MRALGAEADQPGRVYLTGGATAVLLGWRASTIDVDIKIVPDVGSLFSALPRIKEALRINVELASPDQFIPALPGWQERSRFIDTHGRVSFFHYDFYAQALAKIERRHDQDIDDVREMLARGLIEPRTALEFLAAIEPQLDRYPAVDAPSFRRAARKILGA
jgi:hypothetical protein